MTNFTDKRISSITWNSENYHLRAVPFHATAAEWSQKNFVPKAGEIIVYDPDSEHNYYRLKTGDGTTTASALPFAVVTPVELASAINSAGHLKRSIVDALPELSAADINTIYMKKLATGAENDAYEEWMAINSAWELIGSTKVDLSEYITEDALNEKGFLTGIDAGPGLRVVSGDTLPQIEIDDEVVFVFNCGSSTEVISQSDFKKQ